MVIAFLKKPLSHTSMQAMRSRISEDIRIIKTTTKLFVILIMLDKKKRLHTWVDYTYIVPHHSHLHYIG